MKAKQIISSALILTSATVMQAENIFEKPFTGTHGTPQFSAIDDSMWMPAIDRGIELARQEKIGRAHV